MKEYTAHPADVDTDKLPEAFHRRLLQLLGSPELTTACLMAMATQGPTAFRINSLRADVAATLAQLQDAGLEPQPLPWPPGTWTVAPEIHRQLTDVEAARDGRIYLLTPSSLVPGLCLAPQPGEEILDLTAAPGGKTLHLADLMQNQGRIAAVESVKGRFYQLRRNLERCGATMVDTYLADGTKIWRKVPERFDGVLLDAPCSAEGRIRPGQPRSWQYWSPKKIREMARKQQRLAFSAVQSLKPGGRLVYCTCTLAPEENEAIIDGLLRHFGAALEVEDLSLPVHVASAALTKWQTTTYDPRLCHGRRIWPAPPWEGFFIARLRKTASTLA